MENFWHLLTISDERTQKGNYQRPLSRINQVGYLRHRLIRLIRLIRDRSFPLVSPKPTHAIEAIKNYAGQEYAG